MPTLHPLRRVRSSISSGLGVNISWRQSQQVSHSLSCLVVVNHSPLVNRGCYAPYSPTCMRCLTPSLNPFLAKSVRVRDIATGAAFSNAYGRHIHRAINVVYRLHSPLKALAARAPSTPSQAAANKSSPWLTSKAIFLLSPVVPRRTLIGAARAREAIA